MDRLSENAIELNEIEVFNNCSYSCYMNIGNALDELKRYEYIKEKCMLLEFPHTIGKITFYSKQELEDWVKQSQSDMNEIYEKVKIVYDLYKID